MSKQVNNFSPSLWSFDDILTKFDVGTCVYAFDDAEYTMLPGVVVGTSVSQFSGDQCITVRFVGSGKTLIYPMGCIFLDNAVDSLVVLADKGMIASALYEKRSQVMLELKDQGGYPCFGIGVVTGYRRGDKGEITHIVVRRMGMVYEFAVSELDEHFNHKGMKKMK